MNNENLNVLVIEDNDIWFNSIQSHISQDERCKIFPEKWSEMEALLVFEITDAKERQNMVSKNILKYINDNFKNKHLLIILDLKLTDSDTNTKSVGLTVFSEIRTNFGNWGKKIPVAVLSELASNKEVLDKLRKYDSLFDARNLLYKSSGYNTRIEAVIEELFKKRVSFLDRFVQGIQELQKNSKQEECVKKHIDTTTQDESAFRNWFNAFFNEPNVSTIKEELRGDGQADLTVILEDGVKKIIEFKGWWNSDRVDVVNQVSNYLTDFETEGYVFMINTNKSGIDGDDENGYFKKIVSNGSSNYTEDSWKKQKYPETDFIYYESRHGNEDKYKTIYHFIFNVHPI